MLYAYIDDIYGEVENLKIDRAIDAAGKCTFMVPAMRFHDPLRSFRNARYTIYYRDTVLVRDGIIQSSTPVMKSKKSIDFVSFSGTTEMGQLMAVGGKSNANYQEQLLVFVVDDLLSKVPDWRLGYTEGLDLTNTITIDLRSKSTILAQVKEVCNSVPEIHFRYGGYFDDYYELDLGPLNDSSGLNFSEGHNLQQIKRLPSSKTLLYEIEAFGGTVKEPPGYTTEREVYLEDAYDYDNTLASDPSYPIVNKADGTWVVRDNYQTDGDSILKRYTNAKPNTDSPTTAEIEEAGYALYQMCVNELLKANSQTDTYDATGKVFLDVSDDGSMSYAQVTQEPSQDITALLPGSTVLLQGKVMILTYSYQTHTFELVPALSIDEHVMIANLGLEFSGAKQIDVKIKTGIEPAEERYDPEIILAKEKTEEPVAGVGYTSPTGLGADSVTDTHSGVAADTTLSTGEPAKLFSLAMPTVPAGTTTLRFSLYPSVKNATIESVQQPALPATGYIGKISIGDGWDINSNCTLTGVFIFS